MNAASGSTANIEGVTLAAKLFQVMDLKFREMTLFMSFVDQIHKSTTGGTVGLSKYASDLYTSETRRQPLRGLKIVKHSLSTRVKEPGRM